MQLARAGGRETLGLERPRGGALGAQAHAGFAIVVGGQRAGVESSVSACHASSAPRIWARALPYRGSAATLVSAWGSDGRS